jgi:3-isopropylmalate/(R)-2-methylmalate dehydratase large subunit
MSEAVPSTLFDKIWGRHVVAEEPGGRSLLYIDRHLLHEGSFHAFDQLESSGRAMRRPDLTFATADHYVPTRLGPGIPIGDRYKSKIDGLARNAARHKIVHFGLDDVRRGIVHVIGPEQGITLPGATLVCGDSHTSTHGALGALAFGIGASEVSHVLATQTLWQKRPRQMRIELTGHWGPGITAKDLSLALIARIGAGGGTGHVLEYCGEAVRSLDMESRLTLCNMSIEAGARCGIVAPDDVTYEFLHGRPFAPAGALWDQALHAWRALPSDPGAHYDSTIEMHVTDLSPMVTWGTSPQDALPIGGVVPDPQDAPTPNRRAAVAEALDYMGLSAGMPLAGLPIDRVFIGSCTNSRLGDLRAAARVVQGRRALVPSFVSPGSGLIKQAAEAEGLHRIFTDAGIEWRDSGCSMCVGMNGDLGQPAERVASTSNRNFQGRQGSRVRTHLMSPAMAAAAAVSGRLVDWRAFL